MLACGTKCNNVLNVRKRSPQDDKECGHPSQIRVSEKKGILKLDLILKFINFEGKQTFSHYSDGFLYKLTQSLFNLFQTKLSCKGKKKKRKENFTLFTTKCYYPSVLRCQFNLPTNFLKKIKVY